jgi:two-component system, cell cycle response regulator
LGDGGVSRAHARFVWESGAYVLEDLGSANGTYVNGERKTRTQVEDGDVLQFGPSAVFRYSVTDADQEAMLQQLYDASVTDSLTGAFNREHFDNRLDSEISFSKRHETPLSLLLLDIDLFKQVNDTYGHQAGDAVLVEMSGAISSNLRAEDVLARYGGEEFAVILRGIDVEDAYHVGERFRVLVESLLVEFGDRAIRITVSVGVASLQCCGEGADAAALIAAADRRLYAAKRGGRNQVIWQG